MSQSIRHSWRHSLAAVTLVSLIGAVESSLADDADDAPVKSASAAELAVDNAAPPEKFSIRLVAQKETRTEKEPRKEKESDSDADRAEAQERLEQLEDEMAKLKASGKADALEKLAREYKALRSRLEAGRVEKRDKEAAGDDDLRARLRALEAENAKLRELLGDKTKNAAVEPKARQYKRSGEDDVVNKRAAPLPEVQVKLKAMQDEISELAKAGRKEEAEKLAAAARDLAEHVKQAAGKEPGAASIAELREKHAAVEKEVAKLRELGRHAEANELLGKFQHEAGKEVEEYRRKMIAKGFAAPGAQPSELGQVINQLREEVTRLRAEVDELRRFVRERGDEKPADKRPR